MAAGDTIWMGSISLVNGLVLDGTKPFPKSMLTHNHCECGPVPFHWGTVAWYRCTTPVLFFGHRRSPPVLNMRRERLWLRWIKKALHIGIKRLCPGGRFNNTYELLNLRALKFSPVDKIRIFQCMGMIFCVEFQRYPLKFHTKYLTHTLKDVTYKQHWNFKSS